MSGCEVNKKICAAVVTRNRKALLRQCLQAVLNQSRPPDKILVVNNASTDGTSQMLALEFPQVYVLEFSENLGGAGGFHEGFKWAYQQGFDWISAMDDDGYPGETCLERLLKCRDISLPVRGPLVLDKDNPELLAFKLHSKSGSITTRPEAEQVAEIGLIQGCLNPFNGLLIARSVIASIGLPEKKFFMWGDEYEYFLRMKRAGIQMAIVIDAHFYHPADRMQVSYVNLLVKKFPVYYANNPLKDYLILRNQAYIVKKYRGWPGWLIHLVRYLVFYWRMSGVRELSTVISASLHAARTDFSHHKKYLR